MTMSLLVSIAGGSYVASSAQVASFTQTLDMKAASTSGLSSISYEIYDYPPGFALPGGWSQDPATGMYYFAPSNVTTQPPTATLPASGVNNWGPFMLRLRGNNNQNQFNTDLSPNTRFDPSLTDMSSMIWLPSPTLKLGGVGYFETMQRDAMRGYAGSLMSDLRALDRKLTPLQFPLASSGTTVVGSTSQVLRANPVTLIGAVIIDFGGQITGLPITLNLRAVALAGQSVTVKNGAGTQVVTSLLATAQLLTIDCDSAATIVAK